MSSAARFLLEFEATGDQEVVAKIKAVGAAGKQTATDLESLRGIEDPFEPIATGADAAVAPIEGVGTAAEGAVTPLGELGTAAEEGVTSLTDIGSAADTAVTPIEGVGTATEGLGGIFSGAGTEAETFGGAMDAIGGNAEAATGGLTDANTVVGDFGDAASTSADQSAGFGDTVKGMSGSIVAIGGAIGGAVSAFFRYQDAQLKVQKAQNAVARANEAVRKTTENIQAILATATSNTDAIAAANTRYVAAQARVNQLQREGITSGEEYNAANKELQDSQAALSAEFAKGGGDAKKLTNEMNKLELQEGKAATQAATLEKANRQSNQTIMDGVLQAATLAGSIVQIGQGMAKTAGPIGKMTMGLRGLSGALTAVTGVGLGGLTAALGIGAAAVGVFLGAVLALSKAPYDLILGKLDQMGAKIGEILPQAKGPLTAIGDAFRSSLNFLTKGTTDMIKALSGIDLESKIAGKSFSQLVEEFMKFGTVGNAEVNPALDAFIKKGREMGLTDKEIIELAKQHNAEFEKVAGSTNKAAQVTATLTSRFGEQGRAIQVTSEMTELQVAAMEQLAGATLKTSQTATAYATVIGKITQGDVDAITKLNEHTRAQLIATAGYNNSKVAAIQYQEALTAMTASMVADTDQKNANAQATLALVDSELNAQNAIATVNEEYANSVDRLADLDTIMGNVETKQKAITTVSNEFTASLIEQNIELQGTLAGLQEAENQYRGAENAILQTKVSLEESNQALREAKAVHDDMGASMAQLQTALNEEQTALIEEEAALQASIAAGNDSVIMRQRLDNAYLEGVNSIQEWNTELATSAEAEQGAIDALADFGVVFSKLPGYMAPTIENLQLVREAALGSGEAMQEMADMASENFQTMAGEANNLIGGMKDTILEGGKDMKDNWKKNWEEIPQAVRDSMSTAQQEEVKGIAEMQAAAEAAVIELGFDLNTEEFAKARADFTSNLEDLAASSDGIWSKMWSRAAELASTGSETMVARISEIIKSGDPPAIMLQQLEAAAKEFGPKGDSMGTDLMNGVGQSVSAGGATLQTRFGEGLRGLTPVATKAGTDAGAALATGIGQSITSGGTTLQTRFGEGLRELPPKAGEAGGQAGTAFVSEWDANVQVAGNALASIVKTANTLKVEIPITANVQQAGAALASIVKTGSTLKVQIPVTADVSQAHQAIAQLVTKQQTATITYKIVTTGTPPVVKPITTTITYSYKITGKPPVAKPIKGFISYAYRITNKIPNPKEIKRFISYAYRVTNKIPNPPEIKRWITYKYRVVGSRPNPPNLNRTITYRYKTVGSRPAQFGMHENLAQDTMIAAHKGERVDITPGASAGNTTRTIESGVRGTKTAGEIVIPVTLMLDNKVLIRTVRRGLVEEISGAM